MNRAEWVERCAQRLKRCGGIKLNDARHDADFLAVEQEEAHGTVLSWLPPEDAADNELSSDGVNS